MRLLLGIDGGGTGCRAVLADADGRILARAEGGPANISSDPDAALRNILVVTNDALVEAIGTAAATTELPRLRVVMGLAGANVPASVSRLREGLPFVALRVESDAMIALKGALQDTNGIVAAIGTGSVYARQLDGTVRSIGGHGLVLGDEGSGAWLGRGLLSASLRAVDGLCAMTPMLQSILDDLGGVEGVISFGLSARPVDFADIARRIVGSNDPAAKSLMAQADADISASIAVLQPEPSVPVVFLGGLGPALAPRFANRWDIRPALGTGLDGALWMALNEECPA